MRAGRGGLEAPLSFATFDCGRNIAPKISLVINQVHPSPAENERGPNENRIANAIGDRDGFFHPDSRAVRGLAQTKFIEHDSKELAVLCHLDAFRLGSENGDAGGFQSIGEIERRLSAELHDHAFRLFLVVNIEYVLECEWLNIKF